MMQVVCNLDTGTRYYFAAQTPFEAMKMMREYLSYSDASAKDILLNKTESNRFLYFDYKNETYSTKM